MVASIRFSGIVNLQKNWHMKNVKQAVVVVAIKLISHGHLFAHLP